MGDRPMTTEQVASALAALSSELAYPATPSMRRTTTPRGSTRVRTASATPSISTANAVPTSNPHTTVISGA